MELCRLCGNMVNTTKIKVLAGLPVCDSCYRHFHNSFNVVIELADPGDLSKWVEKKIKN
jgi:ribosome-binding protein aMBF1 (putative translation factor)